MELTRRHILARFYLDAVKDFDLVDGLQNLQSLPNGRYSNFL